MNPPWIVALCGLIFGSAAFLGLQLSARLCSGIVPFDDGPRPGKPPVALLVAAASLLGVVLALRGASLGALLVAALVATALAAASDADVRTGIIPDSFTVVPLAVLLLLAALTHNWYVFLATVAVGAPFAAAAVLSKGRGMGWGDVKLVALGGAVLGIGTAVVALCAACALAAVIALARKRRSEPIALAPYLAGAIGIALAVW